MAKKNDQCHFARELLDGYVTDSLEDSQRRLVEEHLKECETCREEVAFIKDLGTVVTKGERDGKGYHLESGLLLDLATDPESVGASQKKRALEHLRTCEQCSEDLRILEGVTRDLALSPSEVPAGNPLFRFVYGLRMLLVRPIAPAWVVAACAAVLIAGLYIFYPGRLTRTGLERATTETQRQAFYGFDEVGEPPMPGPEGDVEPEEAGATVGDLPGRQLPEVPRVSIVENGVELESIDRLESALRMTATEVTLGRPGEPFECVLKRAVYFAGIPTVDVQLVPEGEPASASDQAWTRFVLPAGRGPFIIQIYRAPERQDDFILLVRGTSADAAIGEKILAYRLSISFEQR